MKIVLSVICLCGLWNVFGATLKESASENKVNNSTEKVDSSENTRIWRSSDQSTEPTAKSPIASFEIPKNSTISSLPPNLIQKIISTLRRKPVQPEPNKQLFGGRLPPFIERIIQRIQNYFSVYNPPEYFENNRPPPNQNEAITIICSNSDNESLSCNEMNPENPDEEDAEICDSNSVEIADPCANGQNSPECAETSSPNPQEEYNVVVTHTVVQDSQLNVYSPTDSMHMVSNVVVILEPSSAEYSPPVETSTRNKFYVYVNPTGNNKNQLKNMEQGTEKPEPFQPYMNTTYTVIIRGDKLEEYSNNIENSDNNSLNPDIAVYIKNSTNSGRKCKPNSQRLDCNQKTKSAESEEQALVSSRSIASEEKSDNKVPNINLMLVPPDNSKKNRTCSKNKITNNPNIEYYILKPDNGNKIKEKDNMFYLQKTQIDAIAQTYLPPKAEDEVTTETLEMTTIKPENDQKYPLLFNLFKKKPEELKQQ